MNESRKISFKFKRFDIDDSHCGMKVGTDGVILGAWVSCTGVNRAIDVGTGSGLIALMIAQRCCAHVDAIEIDAGACGDARMNIESAQWCDIDVVEDSFLNFVPKSPTDLIVSNPPFFTTGEKSYIAQRANARHVGSLNHITLIDFASKTLDKNGRLAFIYPAGHDDEIIYKAEMSHLKLRRICNMKQDASKAAIRTMYEFSRIDGNIESEEISIRNIDGKTYSERFKDLCKDFYLEF